MTSTLFPARAGLFLWLCTFVLAGCDNSPKLPPMAPVSGKVTMDSKPVTSGNVSLLPQSTDNKAGLSAGQIGEDGSYTIFTAGKEGAPLGKYKVTVTPSMVPQSGAGGMPKATFNQKYS